MRDRLFQLLCTENDEDYERLLLHTEVLWLSKDDCLRRFVDLFDTLIEFLGGNSLEEDVLKVNTDIFYLSDIFDKLNLVNTQLQGQDTNLISCKEVISGFFEEVAALLGIY